ncbi:hypothetical protein GCM10010341_55710 [Streptomyces noursei]|nr:hypothetical protein GCM10010341_55710 [Streptomyces noursei]
MPNLTYLDAGCECPQTTPRRPDVTGSDAPGGGPFAALEDPRHDDVQRDGRTWGAVDRQYRVDHEEPGARRHCVTDGAQDAPDAPDAQAVLVGPVMQDALEQIEVPRSGTAVRMSPPGRANVLP